MRTVFVLLLLTLSVAGVIYGAKKIVAQGALNNPPPAGAILDLNGLPIPGGGNGSTFQQYTVNFTANLSNTTITLAFRDDPAFVSIEQVSVTDLTTPSGNLLTDGDFSAGLNNSNSPPGWTYANVFGAGASGVVNKPCPHAGGPTNAQCWFDGAVGAYDALTQTIATTIGHVYRISFFLSEDSDCGCNFSRLSTAGNGNTGIDVTAYAQAGLPAPGIPGTPVPPSLWLLTAAAAFLAIFQWRNKFA